MTPPDKSTLKEPIAGRHQTVWIGLLLAALGMFTAIAVEVMRGGPLTLLDARLALYLHAHASGGWTRAMLALTHLHSQAGIGALAVLLGGWFFARKAWPWLLALAIAVPGGMLLNTLLKHLFMRARPVFDDPILTLGSYSFPSGHTASATVLYGLMVAYVLSRAPGRAARAATVVAAVLMVALVGVSRLYLGAHFLSDVLAALAEGGAWLALCLGAGAGWHRRRARRPTASNRPSSPPIP